MSRRTPLLVLGLGNVLCSDDGLGAVAVSLLARRYEVPPGTVVLDGGTLGLSLLPYLEDADAAILVDAIRDEAAPGSVVRLEGDQVAPAVLHRLSPHQVGVADLLDGLRWRDRYPPRLILLGLVPESLALGVECSEAVTARLDALVERIVAEAGALGFPFIRRPEDEMAVPDGVSRISELLGA